MVKNLSADTDIVLSDEASHDTVVVRCRHQILLHPNPSGRVAMRLRHSGAATISVERRNRGERQLGDKVVGLVAEHERVHSGGRIVG